MIVADLAITSYRALLTWRLIFACRQGLTLVHFSAQLQRFFWDRGCASGLCSPFKGVLEGVQVVYDAFECHTRLKLS